MTGYLLAIDTTAGTTVALLENSTVLAEVSYQTGLKHAETIGNAISEVFAKAQLEPRALSAVAVGRGPALFTGLRVGIAAGMMISEATGAKLIGVVSHDAIALEAYATNPQLAQQPLFIYSDARRGEVYWALYGGLSKAGLPVVLAGPSVGKHAQVVDDLTIKFGLLTEYTKPATADWVAKLAQLQILNSESSGDVSALYLRAPDAQEPKPNRFFGVAASTAPTEAS